MQTSFNVVPLAPIPPSIAQMSIVDRLVEVIRRKRLEGQPTTIIDFLHAEETCDLSEAQIGAHIGAAKRVMNAEVVRHDQPAAPVMPWDLDRDYRRQRVAKAAGIIVDLPLSDCSVDAFAHLHQGFSANELADLWSEILGEAFAIIQQRKFATA
ncbi:MAG: hypothetical protein K0Q69_704 [Devosia sp.]|nr:hypothetical protein [Devosia sp.]